jgi:hypothetical protein
MNVTEIARAFPQCARFGTKKFDERTDKDLEIFAQIRRKHGCEASGGSSNSEHFIHPNICFE